MKKILVGLVFLLSFFCVGCSFAGGRTFPEMDKNSQQMDIHCLYIGQGDATLIKWQGKWTMIDTGEVEQRPEIVRLIDKYNVTELENLIITHPDGDHIGGAYAVLNHIPVRHVYDNGQVKLTNTYKTYLKTVRNKGLSIQVLKEGMQLDLGGGACFKVLSPGEKHLSKKDGSPDYNNNSLIMKLVFGDFSMLFTGDAEKIQEMQTLKYHAKDLSALVLKVGHHGSHTSTTNSFLKAVHPEIAVISCGRNNRYGFPHKEPLRNLERMGVQIYRTDRDGTVSIETDGKAYRVKGETK